MNWFSWLLVSIFIVGIIKRLCNLGGWKPDPPPPVYYGISLLIDCFLIIGIFIWL